MKITKHPIRLNASANAVITNFLYLPGNNRVNNLVHRIRILEESHVDCCLETVMKEFAKRHRNIEQVFSNHFNKVEKLCEDDLSHFSPKRKLLLGAYFTKEYSIQAAALFNPSIVAHPDQKGLKPGEKRFVMSMRATGEGHISSIIFQTGVVDDKATIMLDQSSGYFTRLQRKTDTVFTKLFVEKCASAIPQFNKELLNTLPETFTVSDAYQILKPKEHQESSMIKSFMKLEEILDTNYELETFPDLPLNEKVIFPNARAESRGMEDVRLVKFEDGENSSYYGTYTAYNGKDIKTQLVETKDFSEFKIRTLYGSAIQDKGMALFPEKINGKYVMISRQGGEKMNIMFSDDLQLWENSKVLMEPQFSWELVQLGNCGSPIKTEKGWLLLTHGVGAIRKYVISAILLELDDPTKIIGRLDKPFIEADASEREGYVPNVVYTCGFMQHGKLLIIPYALSDSAISFVTLELDELLNEMKSQ